MKVKIDPQMYPTRGGEVVDGNVYGNNRAPAFRDFRIVVGVVDKVNGRHPWNCVVLIHVDAQGNVVGASRQPYNYVKGHWDLIGRVEKMPSMKIEWLHEKTR
jgi:hypothetical protein